jgi:hypothetical protein
MAVDIRWRRKQMLWQADVLAAIDHEDLEKRVDNKMRYMIIPYLLHLTHVPILWRYQAMKRFING